MNHVALLVRFRPKADIASRCLLGQDRKMFSFDHWGDWVKAQTTALCREGVDAVFKDGRQIPELALNPSYVVEVSSTNRLGYIGFWKNGLCDIHIIDTTNDLLVENASMLEVTDETVQRLFSRFVSAL